MRIDTFGVEKWLNTHQMDATYDIAKSCVDPLTLREILALDGDVGGSVENMLSRELNYGYIYGLPALKKEISTLYASARSKNICVTTGGIGANFLAFYALIEPGDHVISVAPTYQQLFSVPESFGAKVDILHLKPENRFLPDVDELKELMRPDTKLICLNNPNNPSGMLMNDSMLKEVVSVAEQCGTWILCDEVYRKLEHEEGLETASIFDLYEKGISTSSMSKVFSAAGIRIGWLAAAEKFVEAVSERRDYTNISCGMLDEYLANIVLANRQKVLKRNTSIVRKNIKILADWVAGETRIDWVRPDSGTTAFLKFDYDIGSYDLCSELLETTGAFLTPGCTFGPEWDRWLRIGYASREEVLRQGLDQVSGYLRVLEGRGL